MKLTDSHKHRDNLLSTMKSKLSSVDSEVWDNINFYYEEIRCDFYHQSAGKTITDTALLDYRDTVEFVIDAAFGTKLRPIVEEQLVATQTIEVEQDGPEECSTVIALADAMDRTTKVLIAVSSSPTKGVEEVNEFFKREGDRLRLKPADFTSILARNSGSKKLFYFDKNERCWKLSKLGRNRLVELGGEGGHG